MNEPLFWHRYWVIRGIAYSATAFCFLSGCGSLQPIFSPNPTPQEQVMSVMNQAVDGSNLWSPIMLVGFLALLAGVINMVLLKGSAKLFIVGVLLAITPPVMEMVFQAMSPLITVIIALVGLGLLGCVMGRWVGRKDIIKRAKARADYIAGNGKNTLTKGQAASVLNHLDNKQFKADYPIGK
jgi:hypothetical protein